MSDPKPTSKKVKDLPIPAASAGQVKGGKSPHSEEEEKLQR